MVWPHIIHEKIREIKLKILKRKVMLNFLIDRYGFFDKLYRWGHIAVAIASPFTAFVNVATTNNSTANIAVIILGCLAAGFAKAKEYVNFDSIKEQAKMQTVKYSQLFDRINNEINKPDDKRQDASEFLYWIIREFNNIELNDPELGHGDKEKFVILCKENNIPYDDDLNDLKELLAVVVEAPDPPPNSPNLYDARPDDNIPPTTHKILSVNTASPKTLARNRIDSDRRQENAYRQTLKELDPKADLKWTMDRFNDV